MSRIEEYLDHIIDPTSPAPASPGSRIETQIAQIIEQGGSGYTKAETDALLAAKADKTLTASTLPATAVANTIYSLGTQSAITTALPAGTTVGDIISIIWYNGSTPATVTITGTMIAFSYTPTANSRSEINAMWDGTNWCLVSNEQAVPASE